MHNYPNVAFTSILEQWIRMPTPPTPPSKIYRSFFPDVSAQSWAPRELPADFRTQPKMWIHFIRIRDLFQLSAELQETDLIHHLIHTTLIVGLEKELGLLRLSIRMIRRHSYPQIENHLRVGRHAHVRILQFPYLILTKYWQIGTWKSSAIQGECLYIWEMKKSKIPSHLSQKLSLIGYSKRVVSFDSNLVHAGELVVWYSNVA